MTFSFNPLKANGQLFTRLPELDDVKFSLSNANAADDLDARDRRRLLRKPWPLPCFKALFVVARRKCIGHASLATPLTETREPRSMVLIDCGRNESYIEQKRALLSDLVNRAAELGATYIGWGWSPSPSARANLRLQLSRPVRRVMPQLLPIDPKRLAVDRRHAARRRDGRFRHHRVRRRLAFVAEEGAAVGARHEPADLSIMLPAERATRAPLDAQIRRHAPAERVLALARSRLGSAATTATSSSLGPLAARTRRRMAARIASGPVMASRRRL